jgi:hypothetical protein
VRLRLSDRAHLSGGRRSSPWASRRFAGSTISGTRFATFALRAGISTFDLSRYMGASLTMIDRHYGHLARDGREHAIQLLDALSAPESERWTLVDAAWTSNEQYAVNTDNRNGG